MSCFKQQLEELKKALKVNKNVDLAKKLGISYSALDGWKRRKNTNKIS